jgi:hypothetical protein
MRATESYETFRRLLRGLFVVNTRGHPPRHRFEKLWYRLPDEPKEGKYVMTDWIVSIAIVAFVFHKLASLTEFDLGRGWLRLKFAVPRTQRLAKRQAAKR